MGYQLLHPSWQNPHELCGFFKRPSGVGGAEIYILTVIASPAKGVDVAI